MDKANKKLPSHSLTSQNLQKYKTNNKTDAYQKFALDNSNLIALPTNQTVRMKK